MQYLWSLTKKSRLFWPELLNSPQIKLFTQEENLEIPPDIDYNSIKSLSVETREKLNFHKPRSIGAARRISGVTPSALTTVIIYLKSKYNK